MKGHKTLTVRYCCQILRHINAVVRHMNLIMRHSPNMRLMSSFKLRRMKLILRHSGSMMRHAFDVPTGAKLFAAGKSFGHEASAVASGQVPRHPSAMCRNIRVLYNFRPPTTKDEIRAAALQYVRKVSGLARPSAADNDLFEKSVNDVAAITERLLASLTADVTVRTREAEREKGRARWKLREARMSRGAR